MGNLCRWRKHFQVHEGKGHFLPPKKSNDAPLHLYTVHTYIPIFCKHFNMSILNINHTDKYCMQVSTFYTNKLLNILCIICERREDRLVMR